MDVEELLEQLINTSPGNKNEFRLEFEDEITLKNLFELLLNFFTNICKLYFGDHNSVVNINNMTDNDLSLVNKYFNSIGFKYNLQNHNYNQTSLQQINYLQNNKYSNYTITSSTRLDELFFVLKCNDTIFKISFEQIPL